MRVKTSTSTAFIQFDKTDIETSIPKRFEKQVERYPQRTAIKVDRDRLTYEALNQAANRVARTILAQTEADQKSVALLFEPSVNMVVAMLGVLKAGKLWVPIDPTYPEARINYILEDAQAAVLLTNDYNVDLAQQLPSRQVKLINIDHMAAHLPDHNLDVDISADDLACIIYTSGSTGQPKGVVQNHRNWLHLMRHYANTFQIGPEDRLALIPSYSHTAGVNTIFRALLNGAAVLPYDLKEQGLTHLADWLHEEEITIFNSVPTLFRHFAQTLTGDEPFPQLRFIITGGEVLYKGDVKLFQQHFPPTCQLVNTLGCTELSSYRQFFMTPDTELKGSIVPVGYEVEDRAALLVDENGNPVRVGEIGEIAVKSPYLALGYWRQPELTAQAFQQAPDGSGNQLYRTGDMGKLLPDGCLLHLGRKDFQVQIRGYRVEIGEIETLLREHPQVKEGVVAALDDEAQEKYLVAYVVPKPEQQLQKTELRRFLQNQLPSYMIPTDFVIVEALPLTPNGKIDRKMLPSLGTSVGQDEETFVPPRNERERQLAAIWQALLNVEQVGVTDNFFELGGHSITILRLFAQIEQGFGQSLPATTIYQAPTIAQLAQKLDQSTPVQATSLVKIRSGSQRPPLFCIPGNLGNIFTDLADLVRHLDPEQPVYGLQDNLDNPSKIETLAKRYLSEIRTVQPEGPYFLTGICSGGVVAHEMARQLTAEGQTVGLLTLVEPPPPMGATLQAYGGFIKLAFRRLFGRFRKHSGQMAQLPTTEQVSYIRLKMKLMANSLAIRRYKPQLYRGAVELFLTEDSLQQPETPQLRWLDLGTQANLHPIPGNHDTITGNNDAPIDADAMKVLAEELSRCLSQATQLTMSHS